MLIKCFSQSDVCVVYKLGKQMHRDIREQNSVNALSEL